jgi:glycine cleavage system aminomethyltransferase T
MGIPTEHNWTREKAGFDVCIAGQCFLIGPDHETTAKALEALIPADIVNLAPGKQRYSQLLNEEGGILDDLMVTRSIDPDEDGVWRSSSTPPARMPTTPISRRACRPSGSWSRPSIAPDRAALSGRGGRTCRDRA